MNILNKIRVIKYILKGYTYENMKEYFKAEADGSLVNTNPLKAKALLYVLPFDKNSDKIFNDRLSCDYMLSSCRKYLPQCIYLRIKKNEIKYYRIDNKENIREAQTSDVIEELKRRKKLTVCSSAIKKKTYDVFTYDGYDFKFNGEPACCHKVLEKLNSYGNDIIVMEGISEEAEELKISVLNESGICPELVEISNTSLFTDEIRKAITAIAWDFPAVQYMYFSLKVLGDSFKIVRIDTGYDLLYRHYDNKRITDFLNRKLEEKKNRMPGHYGFTAAKKYIFAYIAKKKGFETFMYKNWLKGKHEDFVNTDVSIGRKLWAHKHGFYSYRIWQYGLTKDNFYEFLSDYDYKRMRPLNSVYHKWLWNKGFLAYVLKPYEEFLPEEYYYIMPKAEGNIFYGKNKDYGHDINGLISLIKSKGKLAMKPAIGSHGKGFYRIEFADNTFIVNEKIYSEEEVKEFFRALDSFYIVTEYVEMNHKLKRIYDGAACTIRFMVINRNGCNPVIENAYYRIGTSATGFTDNIFSGGLFARVDLETGEFNNAEMIVNHKMIKMDKHPDTGALINGSFDFWSVIKTTIIQISEYLIPLEYMGFDVVVTDTGFKILEINSHQDLHRYPEYNDRVKEYFEEKLRRSKKQNEFGTED